MKHASKERIFRVLTSVNQAYAASWGGRGNVDGRDRDLMTAVGAESLCCQARVGNGRESIEQCRTKLALAVRLARAGVDWTRRVG